MRYRWKHTYMNSASEWSRDTYATRTAAFGAGFLGVSRLSNPRRDEVASIVVQAVEEPVPYVENEDESFEGEF